MEYVEASPSGEVDTSCSIDWCNNKRTNKGGGRLGLYCKSHQTRKYTREKKDTCEYCGFKPIWMGQLDVDHIDGNHKNCDPSNLQTLCANCHRLKTHMSKDSE